MRIVILLSIIVLALSGCCSSGIGMYSMPTQSISRMQSQNIQAYSQPAARKQTVSESRQVKQYSSSPKKNQPSRKKKSGKNKSFLNDAMGVPVKFAKDAVRYIGPKFSKIIGR